MGASDLMPSTALWSHWLLQVPSIWESAPEQQLHIGLGRFCASGHCVRAKCSKLDNLKIKEQNREGERRGERREKEGERTNIEEKEKERWGKGRESKWPRRVIAGKNRLTFLSFVWKLSLLPSPVPNRRNCSVIFLRNCPENRISHTTPQSIFPLLSGLPFLAADSC